jgi:hypothetical protein
MVSLARCEMGPTILPLSVVARRLRVTRTWLLGEAEAGRVPALRAGSRWLCDPAAVEKNLANRARATALPPPPASKVKP